MTRHRLGGPALLVKPPIEAVTAWKAEPVRVNSAPVAAGMLVEVRFQQHPLAPARC